MENPVRQIKKITQMIKSAKTIFKRTQMEKDWYDYSIKKHSKSLISNTKDDHLEYIMIKRKKCLIILDNEILEPKPENEYEDDNRDLIFNHMNMRLKMNE